MQTIKLEIEDHIYKRIVDSGIDLQDKLREIMYEFLDDDYPVVTTEEAKRRVSKAVKSYQDKSIKTVSHDDMWNKIESDCKVAI